MDFLNRAYAQLLELFRSMSPAARITTGLLLVAVIVSLAFLFQTQTELADDFLFGAQVLSDRELNAMEIAFGKEGLNNSQVKQQRVMVPRARKADYYKALADHGAFPENPGVAAREMFAKQSALESRDVRDQRVRQVKQIDLESILRKWDGIENAFVMIDRLEKGGFHSHKELHASVSVHMEGNAALDEQLADSIRRFVANGAGMDVDDVTVADAGNGRSFGGTDEDGQPLGDKHQYTRAQREAEDALKRKIEDHLSVIRGVRVAVHAQLDDSLATRVQTRKYDPKPIPLNSAELQKETTATTPQNARRNGFAGNVGGGNQALTVANPPPAENTSTETRNEVSNIAGSTQEITERAGLVPKVFKVSILVPRSHFLEVWRDENPTPEGEEPQTPEPSVLGEIEKKTRTLIENQVANMLPPTPPGHEKYPLVDVQAFTDFPAEPVPGPSLADTAGSWFAGNWQTLGMFVLAIFGVVMLRGMLRAADEMAPPPPQAIPLQSLSVYPGPQGESFDETDGDEEDEDGNSLKARSHRSGRSLRDELTELVREDPGAAANVLQNWIGDAA